MRGIKVLFVTLSLLISATFAYAGHYYYHFILSCGPELDFESETEVSEEDLQLYAGALEYLFCEDTADHGDEGGEGGETNP